MLGELEFAIEKEALYAVEQFINRSKKRDWSPDDLDLDEIRAYGHFLTPNTIAIIEGSMGVEDQLPFYLAAGEERLPGIPSENIFLDRWGFEEGRHSPTLGLILVASGVRTEDQIAKYTTKVLERGWSPNDHPGLDNLLGVRIYRMFQERSTYINYRGLVNLMRQDYSLPQNLIDKERERGYQIGAAEGVDKISKDELGHHVINLQLVKIHLKYFPEETNAKIKQILDGFKMPALNSLPTLHELVKALRSTRIYDGNVFQRQVVEPTLKGLGFT